MLNYDSFPVVPTSRGNDLAFEIATFLSLGCSVRFIRKRPNVITMLVHHPDMLYPVMFPYDLVNPGRALAAMKKTRESFKGLSRVEKKII